MHKKAIEVFGGEFGMDENTDGKIESILAQQYGSFGYDKYPSICYKAAMLLYFFVKDHCFKDGNKRVALYATLTFLKLNGCNQHLIIRKHSKQYMQQLKIIQKIFK